MNAITDGNRGGIVAGGNDPGSREVVFVSAVTGENSVAEMPTMEELLSAGRDRYVCAAYKQNTHEKPHQICVNMRAAIQESGQRFVQTASLAISVPDEIAYKHLVYSQCLKRFTIFWSACHGNRMDILRQVPVPLQHWMHGRMFLEWFAATHPNAVEIIEKICS